MQERGLLPIMSMLSLVPLFLVLIMMLVGEEYVNNDGCGGDEGGLMTIYRTSGSSQ
jgi:hypothetical protein